MPVQREKTLEILSRLAQTRLGRLLVLAGSSGLHAVSDQIPALTEDVDLLVDADWVATHETELLADMRQAGFTHLEGTCTLTLDDGSSVDLVGFSRTNRDEHIGGSGRVPVMVFADLSTIMTRTIPIEVPSGGLALSASALVVAKLLTIRQEKGSKDKLQALLLIDENRDDEDFLAEIGRLLADFEPDRVEDALADAQAATLSISTDLDVSNPQTAGYARMQAAVARGFEVLERLLREPHR